MRWRPLLNELTRRLPLLDWGNKEELPTDVATVLSEELEAIRQRRSQTNNETGEIKDLSALCLSGGGIRSAAFALGVLQSLSAKGLPVDSAVSHLAMWPSRSSG